MNITSVTKTNNVVTFTGKNYDGTSNTIIETVEVLQLATMGTVGGSVTITYYKDDNTIVIPLIATQNTAQPNPSKSHPVISATGNPADPDTYTDLPSDRSHPMWKGLTGYIDPIHLPETARKPAVKPEGVRGNSRANPTTGFREVITAHKSDGSAVWTPTVEDNIRPGHVTNMKGFSVPMESLSDEEREQLKQRNRSDDAANKAASAVRTAGGAKLDLDQQAAIAAKGGQTRKPREPRVRVPKDPSVGQVAAAEWRNKAPLTRKPWSRGEDGSPSIVDTANQHLAHLEAFLNRNRGSVADGSEEAKGHYIDAAVHLNVARQLLNKAVEVKGGKRTQAVDENTGELLFHPNGDIKLSKIKTAEDVQGSFPHIAAATEAIKNAHNSLMQPAIVRATQDIPSPDAGGQGISPEDNHAAARPLAKSPKTRTANMAKVTQIAGRTFHSTDPFLNEGIARIAAGAAMGDPEYSHLAEVFKHKILRRTTPLGGEEWTSETSPHSPFESPRETGAPGQPTSFTDNPVPRNQAAIDADKAGAAAPRSKSAPAPGAARARRVAADKTGADAIREADAGAPVERDTSIASLTPEQRREIQAKRKAAELEAEARTTAQKIMKRRAKNKGKSERKPKASKVTTTTDASIPAARAAAKKAAEEAGK